MRNDQSEVVKPVTARAVASQATRDASNVTAKAETEADLKLAKLVTDDGGKVGKLVQDAIRHREDVQKYTEHQLNICAASCIIHAIMHSNITPAQQLLDGYAGSDTVTADYRYRALFNYFCGCGPMIAEVDEKGSETGQLLFDRSRIKEMKKEYAEDKLKYSSMLVTTNAFFRFSPPQGPMAGFNFRDALAKLVKLASGKPQKALEARNKGREVGKINLTGLDEAQKLLKKLNKVE